MSHKYQVDVLRKRALIHLSAYFPMTLDGWDRWDERDRDFYGTLPSPLHIIILARQMDALWILPSAFYSICIGCTMHNIINGDLPLELSSTDKVACISGARILETTSISRVLEFLCPPGHTPGCDGPASCAECRAKIRLSVERRRNYQPQNPLQQFLPFSIWDESDWDYLESCCNPCLASMKAHHQLAKQSVWDDLPQIFGLPTWAELERIKAEALR